MTHTPLRRHSPQRADIPPRPSAGAHSSLTSFPHHAPCSTNKVLLFDVRAMRPLGELAGHTGGVSSVAWSPGGRYLASGNFDNTVRVWAHEGLRCVKTLKGHTSTVGGVAWVAAGGLVSGCYDTVRRWGG